MFSLTLFCTTYVAVAKETTSQQLLSRLLQEKHFAYLSHIKDLYDWIAEKTITTADDHNPVEFIISLALKGIVGDILSTKDSELRTLMPYGHVNEVVVEGSDGSFKSFVSVDPPSEGEQCFLVEGKVDYETISGELSTVSAVNCSDHESPGTRSTVSLSEWGASKYGNGAASRGYTDGNDGKLKGSACFYDHAKVHDIVHTVDKNSNQSHAGSEASFVALSRTLALPDYYMHMHVYLAMYHCNP